MPGDHEITFSWRSDIVPASGTTYSAEFDYDTEGRCTLVRKLHKTGSPNEYVHTTTTYGADGSQWWGNAIEVVEDDDYSGHTGIKRTTETLDYDAMGRAVEVRDGAGREFTTVYDLDGRIETITRTDGSNNIPIVTYQYGEDDTSNGKFDNGMPVTITDNLSGVAQTIVYAESGGGLGQPSSISETDGTASTYTVSYEYDSAGSRSRVTYDTPQSTGTNAVKWDYLDYIWVGTPEAGNRVFQTLNKVKWDTTASEWRRSTEEFHYQFDAVGRLAGACFAQTPNDDSGAPSSAPYYTTAYPGERRARAWYDYDPAGRLQALEHWWDTTTSSYPTLGSTSDEIQKSVYTYELTNENRGLRLTADFYENVSGSWGISSKQDYDYDDELGYLEQVRYDDDANSTWDTTDTWTYWANGNRKKENNSVDWTYDELNRILTSPGSITYGHDILGNRTTKTGGLTYGWDLVNRMTSHYNGTHTWNYRYRADGMRVTKKRGSGGVDDSRYRYDGQMLMEEYFSGSQHPRDYIQTIRYGLGARGIEYIQRVRSQSSPLEGFPIYDGHGNMVACLFRDASSPYYAIGNERSYDAWGKIRSGSTSGEPNPRYVASLGHVQDDESGLIYMRARYYEPSSGRFISQDPAKSGTNWLVYANNDPVNNVDPDGQDPLRDAFINWFVSRIGSAALPWLGDVTDLNSNPYFRCFRTIFAQAIEARTAILLITALGAADRRSTASMIMVAKASLGLNGLLIAHQLLILELLILTDVFDYGTETTSHQRGIAEDGAGFSWNGGFGN